jgi:2-oxoglutarate ferredoxin oxidoreductase subunit alpha
LAEKYQIPVIILTDDHLASSYATVDKFDLSKVNIDRGVILSADETNESEYKRHEITESGNFTQSLSRTAKSIGGYRLR